MAELLKVFLSFLKPHYIYREVIMLDYMFSQNDPSIEINEKAKEIEMYIKYFLKKHNISEDDFIHNAVVNSEKIKSLLGSVESQQKLLNNYFSLLQLISEWKPLVKLVLEVSKSQLEKDTKKDVVH